MLLALEDFRFAHREKIIKAYFFQKKEKEKKKINIIQMKIHYSRNLSILTKCNTLIWNNFSNKAYC